MSAPLGRSGLAALLLLVALDARGASPPNAMDLPPSNIIPGPIDIAPQVEGSPIQRPAERRVERAEPSGNPLWAIPLSALTATRDRPIFVPSRRPPAAAVAGPPPVQRPVAVVLPPAEPERPQLTLVGAIANEREGIAVFLDQNTNNVVRLRTGQDHAGWVLRSVKGREAVLQKGRESTTLILPLPGGEVAAPIPDAPVAAPIPDAQIAVPAPLPRPGGQTTTPVPSGLRTIPMGAPVNPRTGEPEL